MRLARIFHAKITICTKISAYERELHIWEMASVCMLLKREKKAAVL